MRDANNPNIIKIPFDPDRTPRAQIEAAIASLPSRRCERHHHELQPVSKRTTVRAALSSDYGYGHYDRPIEFTASYERCAQCPHSATDHDIEVENCPVGCLRIFKHLTIRDENGRPLPRQFGSARLEADRSAREQFEAWLAREAEFRCQFSNQALHRRDTRLKPPFEFWSIEPQFPSCLQCSLERLGITPDDAGASFDNFELEPAFLDGYLQTCRAFAAKPKGVLLLLGNVGTGKTHLAISVLRDLLRRGVSGLRFVKHRDFLARHWHALRPVPFGDETPESPLPACQEASLLVYDELTSATDGRFYEDLLLDLFERRIGHFKPSIITSNLLRGDLEAAIGTRLHDRLTRANFALLEFGFDSKRKSLNADYLNRHSSGGNA